METLAKLFFTFAKIGLVGFGGGMAILPLIYQSVSEFNAIDEEEFANLFAISQATPGPLAVNAATFSGFETARHTWQRWQPPSEWHFLRSFS